MASKAISSTGPEPEFGGMALNAVDVAEFISELDAADLVKISIPQGGSTWEFPTLDGVETASELVAVILNKEERRALWVEGGEDGAPPACSSFDGVHGNGEYGLGSPENETGECGLCPQDAWGSDPGGGKGKACAESTRLALLFPGELVPRSLTLPTSSRKAFRAYRIGLASKRTLLRSVVTSMTLAPQSKGSFRWSVVEFRRVAALGDHDQTVIAQYLELLAKS